MGRYRDRSTVNQICRGFPRGPRDRLVRAGNQFAVPTRRGELYLRKCLLARSGFTRRLDRHARAVWKLPLANHLPEPYLERGIGPWCRTIVLSCCAVLNHRPVPLQTAVPCRAVRDPLLSGCPFLACTSPLPGPYWGRANFVPGKMLTNPSFLLLFSFLFDRFVDSQHVPPRPALHLLPQGAPRARRQGPKVRRNRAVQLPFGQQGRRGRVWNARWVGRIGGRGMRAHIDSFGHYFYLGFSHVGGGFFHNLQRTCILAYGLARSRWA